ncbi:MAG: UDP-N-acetylmuramoyl-L-alanyl-D-glutamate--2,6-diaminopimelate ligase [Erysipelothrix sp.]|nr:UDP-N-acetylmuramoyl-L-alanyl-D-glutamate--2,6-diaminopimelate ligase [Erysipelothrix sp.]
MEQQNKPVTYLNELLSGQPKIKIEGLFTDSRIKLENGMFFCVKGLINDGHTYVTDAIANGAVCIIHSDDLTFYDKNIHYIKVESVLDTLNDIGAKFYKYPSKNLEVFGVTGTNGKTTVAFLLKSVLNRYKKTGYIGTINIQYDDQKIEALHTTPDVLDLQKVLADMLKADVRAVAIEISSHSLEQKRVQALEVDYAIFTNLSHEHLDYHGTMDNYFNAKAKLFEGLTKEQVAIINIDDEYGKTLLERSGGTNITYGIESKADYMAKDIDFSNHFTTFNLIIKENIYPITTNLVAKFNIYNLLAVIAALCESGLEIEKIVESVKTLDQVDGRVEPIVLGQNMQIIVDYAHTPDGFEKIFKYADEIKGDKKIIGVFGSAGERDVLKRRMLGEIADKYCDMIILTEDDPRKECVTAIANKIAEGISGNYVIIENRYDAIYQAIELANEDDVILLLGKGNDQYMARVNGKEFYLGDVEISKKIVQEYLIDQKEEEY